jgi:hypothetical protein
MKLPDYFWQMIPRTGNESEDEENDTPSFTFNHYLSQRRYLAIMLALRFTEKPSPTYQDKFWQVWEMISAWNMHMNSIFSAE